jgi:hypothetical protein
VINKVDSIDDLFSHLSFLSLAINGDVMKGELRERRDTEQIKKGKRRGKEKRKRN